MELETSGPAKRNFTVRALIAFLWFLLIYFGTNIVLGACVGGIAGAGETDMEVASEAGSSAALQLYENYGLIIFVGQIILFSGLAYLGKLPGPNKYKSEKKHNNQTN